MAFSFTDFMKDTTKGSELGQWANNRSDRKRYQSQIKNMQNAESEMGDVLHREPGKSGSGQLSSNPMSAMAPPQAPTPPAMPIMGSQQPPASGYPPTAPPSQAQNLGPSPQMIAQYQADARGRAMAQQYGAQTPGENNMGVGGFRSTAQPPAQAMPQMQQQPPMPQMQQQPMRPPQAPQAPTPTPTPQRAINPFAAKAREIGFSDFQGQRNQADALRK
jgi:hypothetical protein